MIVIEHETTGERMMYPELNKYPETGDPLTLVQYVPREFILSPDQTPVPLTHAVWLTKNWPASTKDPLNTYKDRWKT